jgi:hypothetical protein
MIKGPNGERCDEIISYPKIEFSGPRTSTVYILNPSRHTIEKIRVDDCAITSGMRCDWMARTTGASPEEIYIELKGAGRLPRAVQQLEVSVKKLSIDVAKCKKRCLVVCSSMSLVSTTLQQCKARFKNKYNARLLTVRNCSEIRLDD